MKCKCGLLHELDEETIHVYCSCGRDFKVKK